MNKGEYIYQQLELGHRYRTGNGVKKDIRKAMMHYKNADEAGDLIGHWYYKKQERERDERQLKYILMPVIFLVMFLGAWMDYPLIATIVCLLLCTAFVLKR